MRREKAMLSSRRSVVMQADEEGAVSCMWREEKRVTEKRKIGETVKEEEVVLVQGSQPGKCPTPSLNSTSMFVSLSIQQDFEVLCQI